MPYVVCGSCGTNSYATRPYVGAADCPVCGDRLVDPRLAARPLMLATPEGANGAGGRALGGRQKSRRPADDQRATLAEALGHPPRGRQKSRRPADDKSATVAEH